MRKYWFIIAFFILCLLPNSYADVGIGPSLRGVIQLSPFTQDNTSNFYEPDIPIDYSNYGIEFDFSKGYFGIKGGIFHRFFPITEYDEIGLQINNTLYNLLDATLTGKIFFKKYGKGFNPFFACSGTHRFVLINNDFNYDLFNILLVTNIGFDIKTDHFSFILEAGIIPLTVMRSGDVRYFPASFDLNASASFLYRF